MSSVQMDWQCSGQKSEGLGQDNQRIGIIQTHTGGVEMNRHISLMAAALMAFLLVLLGGIVGVVSTQDAPSAVSVAESPVKQAAKPSQTLAASGHFSELATLSPQQASQRLRSATGYPSTGPAELVNYSGVAAYELATDQGLFYVDANSGRVLNTPPAAAPGNGQVRGRQPDAERRYADTAHDWDEHEHEDDDEDEAEHDG